MFSYRHAFHAGNHADVLKHTTLIAIAQYLAQKDTPLGVIDTHAGAGLYRLDGDFASTSGEALEGIARILAADPATLAPALREYVEMVLRFNPGSRLRTYPGSPALLVQLLRPQDRLRLFELLPQDARSLTGNMLQLQENKQVQVLTEDGFAGARKFLPPSDRRGLLLCDPSYEIKTDYGKVVTLVEDSLRRFATGCYAIWYPLIGRQEAHDLPKRLKALAAKAGKNWLHATLTVKSGKVQTLADGQVKRPGLPASGMCVINPPFTLHAALEEALPQMVQLLGQDKNAGFTLESTGR
ncbi:Ribosomal RNA large subunit methyltransferase J [uncultured Comamonas sp.]|nr:Ribosomal RNA large subunit methyltransferase J [uncultured Comamonas sp.]